MPDLLVLYPESRIRLGEHLEASGFVRVDHPHGRWEGDLEIDWTDPVTAHREVSIHRVAITIDSGFPFKKPEVIPLTELPDGARHRAPMINGGALCLYSERHSGWLPSTTGYDLIDRIREWFVHYHCDDWGDTDRPPDLHLYYARTKRRHLAVTSDDWVPPIGKSGRFAIGEGIQVVLASNPVASNTLPEAIQPEPIREALGVRSPSRSIGIWYRIEKEPAPAEFLSAILLDIDAKSASIPGFSQKELRGLVGSRLRRELRTILAIGYPGLDREHWLFLDVILPAGRRRSDQWERKLRSVRVRSLETAPATRTDLVRRTAHTQSQLANKRVLIFGLGAIGSSVALLLAKAGVQRLTGVDGDQLRPGNCIRHEAGVRLSGIDKATAMSIVIGQHAPNCEFVGQAESWDPAILFSLAGEADVVIDATANEAFALLLNEACVQTEVPLLYVAAHRRASIGRLRVIHSGNTACHVCHISHSNQAGYPLIKSGEEGEFIEAGCGDPTVEASAIDIANIANHAAKAAYDLLRELPISGSECLIVNAPLEDGEAPLNSVGTHWLSWPPAQGCGVCGRS